MQRRGVEPCLPVSACVRGVRVGLISGIRKVITERGRPVSGRVFIDEPIGGTVPNEGALTIVMYFDISSIDLATEAVVLVEDSVRFS